MLFKCNKLVQFGWTDTFSDWLDHPILVYSTCNISYVYSYLAVLLENCVFLLLLIDVQVNALRMPERY